MSDQPKTDPDFRLPERECHWLSCDAARGTGPCNCEEIQAWVDRTQNNLRKEPIR